VSSPITATVFPRPRRKDLSGLYARAEVRGRLAQRLYTRGDGLYELPEDLDDIAPVLFNVARPSGACRRT
jgi:hypothetical protein